MKACTVGGLFLGAVAWAVLISNPAGADEPPQADPLDVQIADLIGELGSPTYATRQRATDQLREIGLAAKDHLLDAVDSNDAEVRYRARRLLVIVLAEDFDARIDAFAADEEGAFEHDLPGWEAFQELVGHDPSSRSLFVEMLRAEPLLLETMTEEPVRLKQALVNRCDQLTVEMRRPKIVDNRQVHPTFSLGSVAALYFVAAHPEVTIDNSLANKMNQLMHRSPLRQEITAGESAYGLKRLLGAWILASANSTMAYQNVWMALQYDIEEGLEPAKHLIQTNQAGSSILPTAIMAVAKLGGENERQTLTDLLEKEQVVRTYSRNGKRLTCQTRDVALVALLHLDEGDPKEYGMDHIQPNAQTLYQVTTIGFENDDQRSAAFEKWRQYRKTTQQQDAAETTDE